MHWERQEKVKCVSPPASFKRMLDGAPPTPRWTLLPEVGEDPELVLRWNQALAALHWPELAGDLPPRLVLLGFDPQLHQLKDTHEPVSALMWALRAPRELRPAAQPLRLCNSAARRRGREDTDGCFAQAMFPHVAVWIGIPLEEELGSVAGHGGH
jgi:hypothetical protein